MICSQLVVSWFIRIPPVLASENLIIGTSNDKLMIDFTPYQVGVLLEIADEKGHPNWQLADKMGVDKSNILKVLGQLEKRGLVEQRGYRKTTNPKSSRPNKKEFPYYLVQDIAVPFQVDDIVHPLILRLNLFNQENAPASHIRALFSPAFSDLAEKLNSNQKLLGPSERLLLSEGLDRMLVDELNNLMKGPGIFNRDIFRNVVLRQKTKDLIKE